jgi:hypothetical protein
LQRKDRENRESDHARHAFRGQGEWLSPAMPRKIWKKNIEEEEEEEGEGGG